MSGVWRLSEFIVNTNESESKDRTIAAEYDELGRMTAYSTASNESGSLVTRGFSYAYNPEAGQYTRTGPDGSTETFVQVDANNRASQLRRGPAGSPVMQADYTYDITNLLESVAYLNGATVLHVYDERHRVTEMWHSDDGASTFLLLEYTYTANNLPETVTESVAGVGVVSTTTFAYDRRNRLIHEEREADSGWNSYDLAYTYDAGGNRLTKVDNIGEIRTEYHYDLEDPAEYGSNNNRLMYFEVYDTSGASSTHVSTTWYSYSGDGNPVYIVSGDAGEGAYSAVRLVYAANGEAVTYVLGEEWEWDGNPAHCPTGYAITFARAFRYDAARARYLVRSLDVTTSGLMHSPDPIIASTGDRWTLYDGDDAYRDHTVSGSTDSYGVSYEPGVWNTVGGSANYSHSDHLGTLRQTSDSGGEEGTRRVFTAFGERVTGPSTADRFGYVGEYGYQAHGEFPFLHVGARYYDPASGRFLQRDPIGVGGGRNVFSYVQSSPTVRLDPSGLVDQNWVPSWAEPKYEPARVRQPIVQSYDEMRHIVRVSKQAQWALKVPGHIVSWVALFTPIGWGFKAAGVGASTCSFLTDGYDLFFGAQ